ncbi:MAG: type II toxin-antitoxin system RelE/ParE family toxin [Candidatus Promineifilaceae bacterium]|nr:type II toxin-antitoxin system RelE/ParE family toxin [Candidatus Promineifilaceae bacterium]
MFDFKIAETKTFAKTKKKINQKLYQKINDVVYPQLRNNPYFGANIKKLKGEFEGVYRYRIGNYRLFYLIVDQQVIVFVIDLKHRKDAYK